MSSQFSTLYEFLLVLASGLLVIVTTLLVGSSDKLGAATNNLVKVTSELGSVQILPYLQINENGLSNFTTPSGDHMITVENVGNGSAVNVKLEIKGEDDKPKQFSPNFPNIIRGQTRTYVVKGIMKEETLTLHFEFDNIKGQHCDPLDISSRANAPNQESGFREFSEKM